MHIIKKAGVLAALGALSVAAAPAAVATVANAPSQPAGRSTATVAPNSTTTRPVLWYGTTGQPVRLAQTSLTRGGYPVAADGVFGPRTLSAVKSFQHAQHLSVDGVIGPRTWSRLDHPLPTLGLAGMGGTYSHTRGFGQARPSLIDNGGDSTGLVTRVTWTSWAGKTASGHGIGTYVAPGAPTASGVNLPVSLRAFGLTTCGGHRAYRHVTWWFPSKGQTYQWARKHHVENYNLCHAQ